MAISSKPSSIRGSESSTIDIYALHEVSAGRLVLDPEEARKEFGESVASKLKLTKDGSKVLWPQPTDDPEDPQNWGNLRKNLQFFIITLAAIVPNFNNGIGIASVFPLARQFHTTTGVISNLTNNWTIFLIGWGGIFFVVLIRRYGRLPVLFWTQFLSLAFLIGATIAPNLNTFAAMRCLNGFFGTCPQVTGLYTITDLFPFHLQARKINTWTMGVLLSSHLSPFLFGFAVAKTTWRWAYGAGCIYGAVVLILIILLMEETAYDRSGLVVNSSKGYFQRRFNNLVGITGVKEMRPKPKWLDITLSPLRVAWRPHMLSILIFVAVLHGFNIGINVTNTIILQNPPPAGLGLPQLTVSGLYATPVIALLIGELIGRYLNDWIVNITVRRYHGVFEAEVRLWTCYLGTGLFVMGFIILGAALQHHLHIAVIVLGWAIAQISVLVNTTAIYAYCSDCFPRQPGEISALLNLVRALGGFSIAYFQVDWASKKGALQTFGVEAAIVAGLFLIIIPVLQWKGRALRSRFSMH
ncbi:MFS general substrate transporter [Cyathus striatus]|nr:MFS general substrate transporter [Cyathus striatus]